MDPWRNCERLFDIHFVERMMQRHLPKEQIETALKDGKKIKEYDSVFRVEWNKWVLFVELGTCFMTFKTAVRKL